MNSDAYDNELNCRECDRTLGYGHGDFNCTYILCPACLEILKTSELAEGDKK